MRRTLVTGSVALAIALIPAGPASATVHEIVAQWCSGHEPLEPGGISGDSAADNFAQPLISTGFVGDTVPFRDGFRVSFNFDHPAAKVVGTGVFIVIGEIEGLPLYLELIAPDPNFPAFKSCPRLVSG